MESALQVKSSPTESIAREIPVEKRRAMGDVFDRWRLNCGWNPWDDITQSAAIASFVYTLDREKVPETAYNELYERVLQLRATALQAGKQIPQFGVDLMLSCWDGEHGLRNELRQREIDAGRTLANNAESVCEWCGGSGWATVIKDGLAGVKRCNHGNETVGTV